ncbi:MAG: hypothetical protein KJ598_01065 [Nanoarchaeota archaeon]|nr:hypothetical protein [Nanoarchaeota archaeon]
MPYPAEFSIDYETVIFARFGWLAERPKKCMDNKAPFKYTLGLCQALSSIFFRTCIFQKT